MVLKTLINLVSYDLYRYSGKVSLKTFFLVFYNNPGLKYSFWMRTCKYLSTGTKIQKYILFKIAFFFLKKYQYKFGISIPYQTEIGPGFYIGHFGCIVVHKDVKIGMNCNISQGVTLGVTNRGSKKGCPIIGDNVYIAPGAKVIGNIKIGNKVAIGANCVVTKDIPDHSVVVGVPGRIISFDGSTGYINHTDY
jgi:serine O-acetyltransferase